MKIYCNINTDVHVLYTANIKIYKMYLHVHVLCVDIKYTASLLYYRNCESLIHTCTCTSIGTSPPPPLSQLILTLQTLVMTQLVISTFPSDQSETSIY